MIQPVYYCDTYIYTKTTTNRNNNAILSSEQHKASYV